jgi:hypothetical protein
MVKNRSRDALLDEFIAFLHRNFENIPGTPGAEEK